jgi:DNA polymerase I
MSKHYTKKVALLDAHAILHRAYHAMGGFATRDGRPTGALYGFITMVLRLYEEVKPDYIFACFDLPKPTFRHLSYEAYKGGRAKTDDALIEQIKEAESLALALNIPVFKQEGFEADDLLGTLAEILKQEKETQVIIASGDMDTFQLIDNDKVVVYTLKKGNNAALFTEKDVIEKYGLSPKQIPDYKGFAGDSSDNIIGIKGIGEKTATTLLKTYGSVEGVYRQIKTNRQHLLEQGFSERITSLIEEGEDDAIFSKTLATIRRDAPVVYEEPKESWIDGVQKEVYEAMCDKYEFRSLKYKLPEKEGENKKETLIIDESELRELQVMTNLLHSEMTNPSLDDISSLYASSSLAELKQSLMDDLKKNNLQTLFFDIEKPIITILEKMHSSGISLNVPFLKQLSNDLHEQTKKLEKEIHTLAGQEFNISSPKQLGDILYTTMNLGTRIKKTKTGQRSTNISELEKIKDEHPIVPLVIEYRELSKLLSTYIDTLPTFVKEDGRVHARFIQTGASTGRFSCEDPNLQNLPIKSDIGKKVREAFIAPKGKVLLSCDYAQIDLRSAAILSGDKHLIEIFEKGIDVHTGTAAKVFKVKEEDVTQEMRRHAKAINFGILYGMGVTALKEGMGVERKEAQMFYDEYKNTFTRLMEYLEEVKREAWDKGYTSTLLGRRREVPLLKSPLPFLRAQGERIAINAPIQGTSADILKLAMIDTDAYIEEHNLEGKVSLLVQIHDELVFEVDETIKDEIQENIVSILQNVLSKRKLSKLPLTVEASCGANLKSV